MMNFEEWWKDNGGLVEKDAGSMWGIAEWVWQSAQEALLNPAGRSLPEQVALAVLNGQQEELGVLADWLAERGLLDDLVRSRLGRLRYLLHQVVWHAKYMDHRLLPREFPNQLRTALGLPPVGLPKQYRMLRHLLQSLPLDPAVLEQNGNSMGPEEAEKTGFADSTDYDIRP